LDTELVPLLWSVVEQEMRRAPSGGGARLLFPVSDCGCFLLALPI
jgi:hypothetical protein